MVAVRSRGDSGLSAGGVAADRSDPPRAGRRTPSIARNVALALAGVVVASLASGCRSGAGAFSAPKWWSFGGGKPESTFASAPTPSKDTGGDPVKPSSTATPYPTTSTPAGYSLAGSGGAAAPATAAAAGAAAVPAVTYGTTPPPPSTPAPATVASAPVATPAAQVGPYSMLPASAPAPSSAPAAAGAFPETAGYDPVRTAVPATEPASRFAGAPVAAPDAGGRYQAALPAAAAAPAVAGSRYASAPPAEGASRYAEPAPAAVPSGPASEAPAASRYASASASRFGGTAPDAAASPAGFTAPPAALAPAAVPAAAPIAPPPAPAESTPPAVPADPARSIRRPDPGYRPAGTSSYRPSAALLADDPPPAPADGPAEVQSAAFETDVAPARDE